MVLRGRAGTDVIVTADEGNEIVFGRFRLVVPRSRRKDNGEWEDLASHWYTVKAWGNLAKNLRSSVRKGDPLIVVGRPAPNAWVSQEGELCSDVVVHAITMGHDNMFGISTFIKPIPRAPSDDVSVESATIERDVVQADEAPQGEERIEDMEAVS